MASPNVKKTSPKNAPSRCPMAGLGIEIAQAPELQTGCPRPFADYPNARPAMPHKRLPVPWLNTAPVAESSNWTAFDDLALVALRDADYMLCSVCGEQLGNIKVYGILYGPGTSTGSGMHPKCAVLAHNFCSHLQRGLSDDSTLYDVWEGEGSGINPNSFDLFPENVTSEDEQELVPDLSEIRLLPGYRSISYRELRELARAQTQTEAANDSGATA